MPPKPKKKPRGSSHALATVNHKSGAAYREGYKERREECVALAWRGKINGYDLPEIAEQIQKALGLPRPPDKSTVKRWVDETLDDRRGEILKHRDEFLTVEIRRLDMIIAKHLPLATDMNLMVDRYVKMEGETVKVVDENGHKEQSKSAEILMKAIETKRRILGVGLNPMSESDTPAVSVIQLNALINQAVSKEAPKSGSLLGGRLLIGAGDPTIEGL